MNDVKEILKYRNLVVNELIIKNIDKFNITLEEFFLLLYFINIDNRLDIDNIQSHLGFTNEKIISLYSSLCQKSIIETVINKKNNVLEEMISLDSFYNKLILTKETNENKTDDIFAKFEIEFGRTLSPIEYETINGWIDNNISEETILKALKEAVLNGVSNLRYIDKILYEWTKANKKIKSEEKQKDLFDYDWLNDDEE